MKLSQYKSHGYLVLKILIVTLCFIYLYRRSKNFDFSVSADLFKQSIAVNWWMLVAASILIFVNWGIEAVKWKYLIKNIEQLSFTKAFSAIMAGVTVSSFTPNRVGEFAGRMFFLKNKLDVRVVALTVIGGMSQLMLTLIFGLPGFLLFVANDLMAGSIVRSWIKGSLVALPVVYFLVFWNLPAIIKKLRSWFKGSRKINYIIEGASFLNFSGLRYISFLSFLRYLIFLSQYILVLSFFNVGMIWWQFLVFIPAIFFIQSIIPTFAVTEIGVRITAAVMILNFTGIPEMQIIAATSLLWVINLMLPSIIGTFTLLFTRLTKNV